jgi:hypothetical protein
LGSTAPTTTPKNRVNNDRALGQRGRRARSGSHVRSVPLASKCANLPPAMIGVPSHG